MSAPAHYQPTGNALQNDWEFSTPAGCSHGFWTEAEAKIAALRTEAQDRETAIFEVTPLAQMLRAYFAQEGQP